MYIFTIFICRLVNNVSDTLVTDLRTGTKLDLSPVVSLVEVLFTIIH